MIDFNDLRRARHRGGYFSSVDMDTNILTLAAQVETAGDATTLLNARFPDEINAERAKEDPDNRLGAYVWNFTLTCKLVDRILLHLHYGRGVSQEDLNELFSLVSTAPRLHVPHEGQYFPPTSDLPEKFKFPPPEILSTFPKYDSRRVVDGDRLNRQLSRDEALYLQNPFVEIEDPFFSDERAEVSVVWPLQFIRRSNIARLDAAREIGNALYSVVLEMMRGEKPLRDCMECGYIFLLTREDSKYCSHRCRHRKAARNRYAVKVKTKESL